MNLSLGQQSRTGERVLAVTRRLVNVPLAPVQTVDRNEVLCTTFFSPARDGSRVAFNATSEVDSSRVSSCVTAVQDGVCASTITDKRTPLRTPDLQQLTPLWCNTDPQSPLAESTYRMRKCGGARAADQSALLGIALQSTRDGAPCPSVWLHSSHYTNSTLTSANVYSDAQAPLSPVLPWMDDVTSTRSPPSSSSLRLHYGKPLLHTESVSNRFPNMYLNSSPISPFYQTDREEPCWLKGQSLTVTRKPSEKNAELFPASSMCFLPHMEAGEGNGLTSRPSETLASLPRYVISDNGEGCMTEHISRSSLDLTFVDRGTEFGCSPTPSHSVSMTERSPAVQGISRCTMPPPNMPVASRSASRLSFALEPHGGRAECSVCRSAIPDCGHPVCSSVPVGTSLHSTTEVVTLFGASASSDEPVMDAPTVDSPRLAHVVSSYCSSPTPLQQPWKKRSFLFKSVVMRKKRGTSCSPPPGDVSVLAPPSTWPRRPLDPEALTKTENTALLCDPTAGSAGLQDPPACLPLSKDKHTTFYEGTSLLQDDDYLPLDRNTSCNRAKREACGRVPHSKEREHALKQYREAIAFAKRRPYALSLREVLRSKWENEEGNEESTDDA